MEEEKMEAILILCLALWFLWAFVFGGIARSLDGHKIEWILLLISFLTIIIIPIFTVIK
jgi:hypothetical protein